MAQDLRELSPSVYLYQTLLLLSTVRAKSLPEQYQIAIER